MTNKYRQTVKRKENSTEEKPKLSLLLHGALSLPRPAGFLQPTHPPQIKIILPDLFK